MAFLDENGVSHFWAKIKELVSSISTVAGTAIKQIQWNKSADKGTIATTNITGDHTYTDIPSATRTEAGLLSAADKAKLDGMEEGANNYVHPRTAPHAIDLGLYKTAYNDAGHATNAVAVTKGDITGLGIPAQDTTYGVFAGATTSAAGSAGLVPAPAIGDKGKVLCGDGAWGAPAMHYGEVNYESAFMKLSLAGAETQATIPTAAAGRMGLMSAVMFSKLNDLPTYDILESTYAKKTDIAGVYKYKGSVAAASNLPTTGQTKGDVYNIEAASSYGPAGTNVAWDGSKWDALGGLLEIEALTNAEIDAICV